jgi:hypothetical protein
MNRTALFALSIPCLSLTSISIEAPLVEAPLDSAVPEPDKIFAADG